MPTSTNVTNLKINELTEAQYDTAVQQGVIGANELSVITDLDESIQVSTMPTASATELGNIYQFVGTTDANYTNGYFYKCVSDGQQPAVYSWSNIQVQASSGGLPTQTGNAGKFLTTDGTDASWGTTITGGLSVNFDSGNNNNILVSNKNNTEQFRISANYNSKTVSFDGPYGCPDFKMSGFGGQKAIYSSTATQYVDVTLGQSGNMWANVYTRKINNGADITVPAVAGEMAVKQVNTTITLTSAGWSSNTQTVNVTGMTATGVVMVSPDPTDQSAYTSAGILCTAQAAGTLTFTCDTVPSGDIDVNVVML